MSVASSAHNTQTEDDAATHGVGHGRNRGIDQVTDALENGVSLKEQDYTGDDVEPSAGGTSRGGVTASEIENTGSCEDEVGVDPHVALMESLEQFFSAPEFTSYVREFVQENSASFVVAGENEEQPLSNYDLYMKYTKLIEGQLEEFLDKQGITHQDIVDLCVTEKEEGNRNSYCLDYIIASTQYDAFIQMMTDFKSMNDYLFDTSDFAGYSCLGNLEPLEPSQSADNNPPSEQGED